MFENIEVDNITVFRKARFAFVPGVNVLVGANSTGKTHLMKLLYAIQKRQSQRGRMADVLEDVFRPENLGDLVRKGNRSKTATVAATWNGVTYSFGVQVSEDGGYALGAGRVYENVSTPVFIPVKDMLGHSVGFLSLYDQRDIDFDVTYRDILSLAFTPSLRPDRTRDRQPLLDLLAEKLEGTVEMRGERFYLVGETGRHEMHMVAEGWRKLALLYLLIANGSLGRASVLYWDEPETNLNPSIMDELVHVLFALSRFGVQIFLATHDYIMLKELDLQREAEDSLRFFAMERKPDGSVKVNPASTYSELSPNLIAAQFERIYDMEIDRALGE
jgi:energy-coupling factor transporter ATP-binding protein EcfA2